MDQSTLVVDADVCSARAVPAFLAQDFYAHVRYAALGPALAVPALPLQLSVAASVPALARVTRFQHQALSLPNPRLNLSQAPPHFLDATLTSAMIGEARAACSESLLLAPGSPR